MEGSNHVFSRFAPGDTISRDVCIVGGGSNGTYTAIRLQDFGKSVILLEKKHHIGGHTETFQDPESGSIFNVGVIVFGYVKEVKQYFGRFGVPLTTIPPLLGDPEYVDFATGETIENRLPSKEEIAAALKSYAALIHQYPEVQDGFHLKYPIAEDLLMPFGQFVEKYSLQALIPTVFAICQGYVPFLEISTLYVFKYLNRDLLNSLAQGFLTTSRNNTGELYQKAAENLGENLVLNANIVAMDRNSNPVKVVIETPYGRKLILAKRLVSTIPPVTNNLLHWDLSSNERSVFERFHFNAFYSGVLKAFGFRGCPPIYAADDSRPYGIPKLPGIYTIHPHSDTDLVQVYYGSPHPLEEDKVRTEIIQALKRIQIARSINTNVDPIFMTFVSHSPFNMMVSKNDIQSGFYDKLYALQGKRSTFYNGAAFHAQDSSVLWRFTEQLLPRILNDIDSEVSFLTVNGYLTTPAK